ncbi:polyadenylate-binding protein 3 [Sesbania bispinosa]|nr:polyadenylate-binding protein 3 [Sesbania bispinosa]
MPPRHCHPSSLILVILAIHRKPSTTIVLTASFTSQATTTFLKSQPRSFVEDGSRSRVTFALSYPWTTRLAPQQLYYGQGTPGYMTTQSSGYGYQQQFYPGMHSVVAPNFIMPYHLQRQGHPMQRMGYRRGGNCQHVHQNQMQQCNSNQWFRDNQQRPGALSNTLTSALASTTLENQRLEDIVFCLCQLEKASQCVI